MKNNFSKKQIRVKAIELYCNAGWQVTDICKSLNCSRRWFYKWLKRYQIKSGNSEQWFKEESRKPKTKKKRIDTEVENLVLETREALISIPFMQYGPQAIF